MTAAWIQADDDDPVERVVGLFEAFGDTAYDEDVSLAEHCLQCAQHALDDGAPDWLVGAALLHDVGHLLLSERRGHDDFLQTDWLHDSVAQQWLAPRFGQPVADAVGGHVEAKRWLCANEPEYLAELSSASVASLGVQGGPMSDDESQVFAHAPLFDQIVSLRRWDDRAKVPGTSTRSLHEHRALLHELTRSLPIAEDPR